MSDLTYDIIGGIQGVLLELIQWLLRCVVLKDSFFGVSRVTSQCGADNPRWVSSWFRGAVRTGHNSAGFGEIHEKWMAHW